MSTLYELFKVPENASQAEITEAYNSIIDKSKTLQQTAELTEKLQRIEIAYGILSNPEKRKKYDMDLTNKRANELLENVHIQEKDEPLVEENSNFQIDEEKLRQAIRQKINTIMSENNEKIESHDAKLEEKEIKKQQRQAKKMVKKAQQDKREKELEAYGRYLERQGYKVKYPWTWKRVKKLIISILTVIIAIIIIWHIPAVNHFLKNLYEENIVVKFLVNAVMSVGLGITETIKAIFGK